MTTTPPEAPSGPADRDRRRDEGPRVTRDEIRDLGRLRRSVDDRKVAGVAGGLARHLDIDPLILRVAFVVLVFFGGAGLLAVRRLLAAGARGRLGRGSDPLDDRSRTLALLGVGVLAALALLGDSWGGFWFPWPLAVIALVALLAADPQQPPPSAVRPRDTARPAAAPAAGAARRPTYEQHRTSAVRTTAYYQPGPAVPPTRRPATRASADRSCSGSRSR